MIFLLWWNYRAYIISIDYTDWIVVQCRPIRFERQRVGRTRVWICQHKVMTGKNLLNQQIPKNYSEAPFFFEALLVCISSLTSRRRLKHAGMQLIAGGSAGCVEVTLMHPLDLVKTRFQLQSAAQVVGAAPGVNVQASLNPHHHSVSY